MYDENEEEEIPQKVENGRQVKTVQIKQPTHVEDTEWNNIPQRGLFYTLKKM